MINKIATLDTFYITRGDTYYEVFLFNDENDLPLDLSGYTDIQMDIRKGIDRRGTLIESVSLNSGITVSGISFNILTIEIDSNVTENWIGGIYNRDIRFTDLDNKTFTLVEGKIEVRENITI